MDHTYMLQLLKYCNELLTEIKMSPTLRKPPRKDKFPTELQSAVAEVMDQLNSIIVSLEDEDETLMG